MLDHIQIKKNKYEMELDERVEELEVEIGDLQSEIDRLFQTSGDNQDAINEINNQITQINSEIDALKKSMEDVNARVDECDIQIEDIKNEHIRDIASLEEKVMELKTEITSVSNELKTEVSALNQKDIEIDAHLENTDKNVQTNSDNIADLTKQIANKNYKNIVLKIPNNRFSKINPIAGYIPCVINGNSNSYQLSSIEFNIDLVGQTQYANYKLIGCIAEISNGSSSIKINCNITSPLFKKVDTVSVYYFRTWTLIWPDLGYGDLNNTTNLFLIFGEVS